MARLASVEEVAKALGQAIRTDTGFKCLCPIHEDTQPSLSLYYHGKDGRPNAHCFVCGTPPNMYKAIAEKTGLELAGRELPSNRTQEKEPVIYPAPIPWSPVRLNGQAPSKHWEYVNADGKLMFVVARYNSPSGKIIRPYSVVDRGGQPVWKSKLPLQYKPPYNLTKLLQNPDAPVLVVEGEKAADAASLLPDFQDYVVITFQGGKDGWKKTDLSACRGRHVRLWPDNDETGLASFINLGRWFQQGNFAKSVKIADVPKGFPIKWDLADELPEGRTIAAIQWYDAPEPDREFSLRTITPANYLEALDAMYYLWHDGTHTYTVSREYLTFRKGNLILPDETHAKMTINHNHEAYDICQVGREPVLKAWQKEKMLQRDYVVGYTFHPETLDPIIWEQGVKLVNSFTGWAHKPDTAGSCQLFKNYILDVLCNGDEDAFAYIWNFLAHMIQFPAQKPNVALLFRGAKGSGKSFFFNMLHKLLGGMNGYGYVVQSSAAFSKNFNGHYAMGRLGMFINEWEITKSRQIENIVKAFITEDKIDIDIKYQKNFAAPNFTRVFGATNHNHVWNTTEDERRISIFEIGEQEKLNRSYFDAIEAELFNHGFGKLMLELMETPVIVDGVMRPYSNIALSTQKQLSRSPAQNFAYQLLLRGEIFLRTLDDRHEVEDFYSVESGKWHDEPVSIPTPLVNELLQKEIAKGKAYETAYSRTSKDGGITGVLEWLGADKTARSTVTILRRGVSMRVAGYKIPKLAEARLAYAARSGLPYEELFDSEAEIIHFPSAKQSDVPF